MKRLEVHSVEGNGNLDTECVWLDVIEDIPDLAYYKLADTTYTDDGHISNELRHTYWFSSKAVKKGDWIKLMSKTGTYSTGRNNRNTTTHTFYWGLGKTIWNKDGDAAVLFKLETWKTKKV